MIFAPILSLLALMIVIPLMTASSFGFEIYSQDSNPHNVSYPQWTAKWQQWLISSPQQENPAADSNGMFCAMNQDGPVWFLAGTLGDSVERMCEIPYGKDILFPVIVSSCDDSDFLSSVTSDLIISCAKQDNNYVAKKEALINGMKISEPEIYRVTSPLFEIEYPLGNIFGKAPGNATAVGDGFWVFLKPLEKGDHVIQFNAITPPNPATGAMGFVVDVTYKIKIA